MRPRSGSQPCINIIRHSVLGEEGRVPRMALALLHFTDTETIFPT